MLTEFSRSHDQINEALAQARDAFATDPAKAREALAYAQRHYAEWQAATAPCPEVDAAIRDSLRKMQEAIDRGDNGEFNVLRQVASKSLLTIAYRNLDAALSEGDAATARAWWPLFVAKFKWDKRPVPAVHVMAQALSDGPRLGQAKGIAKAALVEAFSLKVKEEAMEAVAYGSKDRAVGREKAIEAVVYFGAVDTDLQPKLGAARHQELKGAVNDLYAAASAGNMEQVKALANRIKAVLS